MKRYEKFVLEEEKGITFEVSEGTSGELIIRASTMKNETTNVNVSLPAISAGEYAKVYSELPTVSAGEYAKVLSVYTDSAGNKAVVPQGWTVSGVPYENIIWGEDKGLVIYQIPEEKVSGIDWKSGLLQRNYNQFVWVPVSLLTANATLDGIHFNQKFGRINYKNDEFSESEFHEPLVGELLLQKESVDKYNGFYIARYEISKTSNGKLRSVKGSFPIAGIMFDRAQKVAAAIVDDEAVSSHLPFGAEYDSVLKWFVETESKTHEEIAVNSNGWGNYWPTGYQNKTKTGSQEKWCVNNVYDFAGNLFEWTQEQNESSYRVVRGGSYAHDGDRYPIARRNPIDSTYPDVGFRVALYIK